MFSSVSIAIRNCKTSILALCIIAIVCFSNDFSKMSIISIDIKKGDSNLEKLDVPINGSLIEDLLLSLKKAKNDSNQFLTTLVNKEKDVKSRKLEEIESSEDDTNGANESSKRQKKTKDDHRTDNII